MPFQVMELRLFVKGQVLEAEGVVKAVSSLSPPPPPRTPPTKPGGALYGLDFRGGMASSSLSFHATAVAEV